MSGHQGDIRRQLSRHHNDIKRQLSGQGDIRRQLSAQHCYIRRQFEVYIFPADQERMTVNFGIRYFYSVDFPYADPLFQRNWY